LIERLWKFLRKEALQKWHPTFEEMQKAVADVLDNLPKYHEQLQTLMTERFHLTPMVSTILPLLRFFLKIGVERSESSMRRNDDGADHGPVLVTDLGAQED
jgi:hypothetical protein